MGIAVIVVGLALALLVLIASAKVPAGPLRGATLVVAVLILLGSLLLSSVAYVGASETGILSKNAMGANLKEGRIIAVNGEMGVQADVLSPGWHFGVWPVIYSVKSVPLVEIKVDEVGLLKAKDGEPMDEGQLFADEWPRENFRQMLDAHYFLTTGKGKKGKQVSVLTPGKYRINTDLFEVTMVKQTEVTQGEVAVLKANFGKPASLAVRGITGTIDPTQPAGATPADTDENTIKLAKEGEMGIRAIPLLPGKYPLNTDAFTVVEMWTTQMIAHYAAAQSGTSSSDFQSIAQQRQSKGTTTKNHEPSLEEREITVRTSDGFTFPVDVRVEYVVEPHNAAIVVAKLGDDEGDRFRNALNSAVRAIFRNNAESVKALDYVQMRSHQEQQSTTMLSAQMARFGISITAVRIGNVGDEKSLGTLLKTQTDREIAKQEQQTFQEQQKAAEQKKELTRATQEADEEKRLATAAYQVKIADETKKQKIIEANADAQSIKIKAEAQADAYKLIAAQIGKSNAALMELLKIVGEKNIQITPRVMINGGGAAGAGNSALTGTLLDSMLSREEETAKPATAK